MPRGRGSSRTAPLPPDWPKRRAHRLGIDGGRCTHIREDTGERCEVAATDCDHIGEPTDHRIAMLRSKCPWHHRMKTSRDAGQASAAAGRARRDAAAGTHPGLLTEAEWPDPNCPF